MDEEDQDEIEVGMNNSSSTSESIEDEEEHDEDEVPLEPRFKYDRMKGDAAMSMLKKELLTAIDIDDKFVAIGTQSGKIYVIDHEGFGDFQNVPIMNPHRCAVNKLKFDETGSYIISCANDGKVVVSGIGTDKLTCTVNVNMMPRSVAFSPDFATAQSTNSFIVGERSLMLYDKKFFKYKTTVIYSGAERDGFINCCSWKGNYIAMTNDLGTQVFDRIALNPITSIQPSHDIDKVRSSRAPPKHIWLPDKSLVIGWADTITIVRIVTTDDSRRGEIHNMWHLKMFVSGLSYIIDTSTDVVELVVTGLKLEDEEFDDGASMVSTCTTLTAMESSVSTTLKTSVIRSLGLKEYELQSEDTMNNVQLTKYSMPCNIHMAGIPYLNTYFIMTLKDIVTAIPYGPEDGVKWRLKYKLWDAALDMAKNNIEVLSKTDVDFRTVGRRVIEGFLKDERPKAASARLPKVCGESKDEWEWAVNLFERNRLCTLLADVLPTSNPQLEPENYEGVLQAALFNDVKLFRKLVQMWSPDLYRTFYIIHRTQWRIQEITKIPNTAQDEKILMDSLAHLYLYERKYDQALKIFMSLGDTQIFNVVNKHQLFEMVKDQIQDLMKIDSDLALRLVLDNEDSVEPSFVMDKIARQPKLQMAFLTKLLSRNEGLEFADRAIQLYAEHDRKKLLPFLRKNEHYHLNQALKICQAKNYTEEVIFLLTKGGNHFDAVNLMVKEYSSIDKVIDYCKDQNDRDLWIYLVEVVSDNPAHLAKLLVDASSCLNPLLIIEKMPLETDIPGLRNAINRVLSDYSGHLQLQKGCYDSTLADSKILITDFLEDANSAVFVHTGQKCAICGLIVNCDSVRYATGYRIHGCGHVIHMACSGDNASNKCSACREQPID
ncbi:unnamed protein product [Caenorhabditis angaria]|uniref:Vps41 beta-propeller domain-containing protein n=1 Tax=Caenorhabditis angaria TaxID=860376 RepID=A0A9P1N816_9PELO|nr:unnamed protein product [Caenorhabditis angaria]